MRLRTVFEENGSMYAAKESCKRCYGRGYVGTYMDEERRRHKLWCECLVRLRVEKKEAVMQDEV